MGKEKNKGFTLIELIVSVAILAIITAPFLNAFVIAAKNNSNSRVKQTVTNHSESIMEKFKAESFEMLSQEFKYIDVGEIDGYAGQNYYYYDSANAEYVFNVNAAKLSGNSESGYSATVKMKPQTYSAPDLADIDNSLTSILISEVYRNDDEGINSLYSEISGLPDYDKNSQFKSNLDPNTISMNIQNNTLRTTFVYVTYDGSHGTRPFQVSVSVAYECNYGNGIASKVYTDVFTNSYETVPDVLLFYTMYPYGTVTTTNDKIVVDNQIPDNIIEASAKKCKVYISNQTVALQNGKKLMYSGNNLSNIYFKKGGTDNTAIADDVNNPGMFENDNTEAYMSNDIYDATGINKINSLVGKKDSVKLYELTVDIYWHGNLKSTVKSSTDTQN